MTLYEINKEIELALLAIFDSEDPETGEVDEAAVHHLEDLNILKDEKIEAYGCYLKNLQAESEAIKAEEEALKARRKSLDRKFDRLKHYVSDMLAGENWSKSSKVAFSFRSSDQTIIDDESKLPAEFVKTKIETTPDKMGIKKAIKNGEAVPGAHLEKVSNMSIK